jgi:hypothetical protein
MKYEGPVANNLATVDNRDLARLEASTLITEELIRVVDALVNVSVAIGAPHQFGHPRRIGKGHLANLDSL